MLQVFLVFVFLTVDRFTNLHARDHLLCIAPNLVQVLPKHALLPVVREVRTPVCVSGQAQLRTPVSLYLLTGQVMMANFV